MEKERDEIEAERLHNTYDYLHHDIYKEVVEENDDFDPTKHDVNPEDEDIFTTDYSEMEEEVLYKRYKFLKIKNNEKKIELTTKIENFRDEVTSKKGGSYKGKPIRKFWDY